MPVEKKKYGKEPYDWRDQFPFGVWKGTKFSDVDPEYLLYIYDLPWIKDWPGVEKYIADNFDMLLEKRTIQRKGNE